MVGYPNSIWDRFNNRPIYRKGITGTSIKYRYENKPVFLIDVATFPGSSGSPVFVYNPYGFVSNGEYHWKRRSVLVGIAYAVFNHVAVGQVQQIPINRMALSTYISVPNHLGLAIRYDKLFDFGPLLGVK
jgi:hypothetical protein